MKTRPGKPKHQKRKTFILSSLLLVVAAVSAFYLFEFYKPAEASAPELQTSRVRTGDIVITVDGAGSLLPGDQVDLGFRSSGVVAEVLGVQGQKVSQGDIIAHLDDHAQKLSFAQAEANLDALFTAASLASYEAEVVNAQIAYDDALLKLEELEAFIVQVEPSAVDEQDAGSEVFDDSAADDEAAATDVQGPDEKDLVLARARMLKAELALTDAQRAYEIVQAGPDALPESLYAADGTALAKLRQVYLAYENARLALENTRLLAPIDGTITSLKISPGQSANTNPVVTLSRLDQLLVRFYVDETDLGSLAPGMRVIYTFNAYADTPLEGTITVIENALQTVEGSPVVVVWGSLDPEPGIMLLPGMTADVEVVAGEAYRTPLVPVQALREVSPGSYAVFLVQEDGSLKLTQVTVGLRDFANAQILSGVNPGDVVSTGTVETR